MPTNPRTRTRSGLRRSRRRPRRWLFLPVLVVLAAVVYGLTRGAQDIGTPATCTFVPDGPGEPLFTLEPAQAQEAAVIAAVGSRLGLPDHAVTVALAAALQESKLRDLTYGDRDSVGLFQQRPSQGWGTRAQILDPTYAANAFFNRLRLVPGWETMDVADAVQSVQHSADGAAYAQWTTEARTLAVDLTGEQPAGVACRLPSYSGAAPQPGELQSVALSELGFDPSTADPGPQAGWRAAAWLVAHAQAYHLASVSYQDRRWTSSSGRWSSTASAVASNVTFTQASD